MGGLCGNDTPSPPPSPDYMGIARTQARASNPNVVNPLGSQTVTWDGDQPTVTQSLTPAQQALLTGQQGLQGQQQQAAGGYLTGLASQGAFHPTLTNMVTGIDSTGAHVAPTDMRAVGQQTSFGDVGNAQRNVAQAGQIQNSVGGPETFDQRGLQAQNAILSRQEPLLDRQEAMTRTQLANQGITPGSEAYTADMNQLGRNRTDAEQQAILSGNQLQQQLFGMGLQSGQFANQAQGQQYGQNATNMQLGNAAQQQEYAQAQGRGEFANQAAQNQFGQNLQAGQFGQQGVGQNNAQLLQGQVANAQLANTANQQQYNQQLGTYQLPAQMYANLQGGGNVQMPQFNQFQNPNYMGAAQNQAGYNQNVYNQQVGQQNAQTQGLFGLGSSGLLAAGMYFSDRRLKSHIKRIGTHPLGIGIYEYDIFGEHDVGVMADEVLAVKPEAVAWHPNGYMMVNYAMLGD